MRILLKFWKKGKKSPVIRHGDNTRVLAQRLASHNWQKAYLKVVYGKDKDCFDCLTNFINEGYYLKKEELQKAYRAFTGEKLW